MDEIIESNIEDKYIYVGPGMTNDEIDLVLSRLYEDLINYKESIFSVTEKLSPCFEDQIRLALNIAETDGELLKRLVVKECEKRRELNKIEIKKTMPVEGSKLVPINQIQHYIPELLLKDASEIG